MGNSNSAYSCGECGKKVEMVDGEVKRTCMCSANTTVVANMAVSLKYSGSKAEYYQLLETGKEFYRAALFLKNQNLSSIVYLHVLGQAFENVSKYLICRRKGYNHCYPKEQSKFSLYQICKYLRFPINCCNRLFFRKNIRPGGRYGHKLSKILKGLKECGSYKNFLTDDLESDINKLSDPYNKRVFAYGDFLTFFRRSSEYKTCSIFEFLKKALNYIDGNIVLDNYVLMKFLLTSSGISNTSIEKALFELLGKPASETRVVFVPTAANQIADDKSWLAQNYNDFLKLGLKSFDIVDIAAVSQENWLARFKSADVLCFGGGDEQYLAKMMRETGLTEVLPELLQSKVYVGISAGSMVVGKLLPRELTEQLWPEESFEGNEGGMGLYDFSILPHLNSDYFAHLRAPLIQSMKEQFPRTVYALDDQSALKITDQEIEMVSEGEYLKIEK